MTYKLPHSLDRPVQRKVVEQILNLDKKYLVLFYGPGRRDKETLSEEDSKGAQERAIELEKI